MFSPHYAPLLLLLSLLMTPILLPTRLYPSSLLVSATVYNVATSSLKHPFVYSKDDGDLILASSGTLRDSAMVNYVMLFVTECVSIMCTSTSQACMLDGENNKKIMEVNYISQCVATFTRLYFYRGDARDNNLGSKHGGALQIYDSEIIISDCKFAYNRADKGGAIYLTQGRLWLFGNNFYYTNSGTNTNSADTIGDDGYREGGTWIMSKQCPAGYQGPATQGHDIDITGNILGDSAAEGDYQYNWDCPSVCASGKYSTAGATDGCTSCAQGKYLTYATSSLNHDSEDDCISCTAGKYSASTVSAECIACQGGTYAESNAVSSSCFPCPVGKHIPDTPSYAYTMFHDSEADCISCTAGRYAPGSGMSACAECGAGRFSEFPENDSEGDCLLCAVGTSSSVAVRTSPCAGCSVGKFAPNQGKISCENCITGTKAVPAAGSATHCVSCPAGTYSGSVGSTSCAICDNGYYASDEGSTHCSMCPAGKSGDANLQGCTVCAAGTFSGAAAASCTACDGDGEFSVTSDAGSSYCSVAGAGKKPLSGRNGVGNCAAGKFSEGGGE